MVEGVRPVLSVMVLVVEGVTSSLMETSSLVVTLVSFVVANIVLVIVLVVVLIVVLEGIGITGLFDVIVVVLLVVLEGMGITGLFDVVVVALLVVLEGIGITGLFDVTEGVVETTLVVVSARTTTLEHGHFNSIDTEKDMSAANFMLSVHLYTPTTLVNNTVL